MQVYAEKGVTVDLKGATLVAPAVAFANIGELAIDLLVCSLKAQLVARLDSANLLACVGNNAYQPQPAGVLATSLELYQVPATSVYLLQQRAPAIPGRQQAFAAEVAGWAQAAAFSQVLLLCGLDAQYRKEQQLEGSQLRYHCSSSAGPAATQQKQEAGLASGCEAAGVQQLEADVLEIEQELHGLLPPWPLLQELQRVGVSSMLLSAFAAEGDNAADAMGLAGAAASVVLPETGLQQQQLQPPCSWAGLMGRKTIDTTLF